MFSILRVQIIIGFTIFMILTWATQNVCRYNFVLDKKKNLMNIISDEVKPNLGLTEVYYYKQLNCNNTNFSLDLNFVITPKNINAIVQIYELDLNEYVFKKSALVNIPTMKKEAMINLNE